MQSDSSNSMASFWQIDRKLLPMKAHYFLFSSATAPIVPFMSTYVRQLGFSTVTVGFIFTVLPLVTLVVRPVLGFIADKFHMRKSLIMIMQVIIAASLMGVRFIKPTPEAVSFEQHCDISPNILQYCPDTIPTDHCLMGQLIGQLSNDTWMQCEMQCNNSTTMTQLVVDLGRVDPVQNCIQFQLLNTSMDCTTDSLNCVGTCSNANVMKLLADNRVDGDSALATPTAISPQLWQLGLLLMISWSGMAVVDSLGFTLCFTLLGDNPHRFGQQRLWGSVGWGIVSMLSGLLVDAMSRGQILKDYSGMFYLMLAFMTCDLIAAWTIQNVQTVRCPSIVSNVGRLLLTPRIFVYFVWCITVGMLTSLIWNFLFWHLEELAEAVTSCDGSTNIKTLQGLAMAVQTFGGEIPLFFLSGRLIRRIGHAHAMSLVLGAMGVRLLCYSVLSNPWWVLPVEMLQGVTFGIFITTMSSYASKVAPTGAEATLQSMAGAMFEGIGVSTGGVIGGYTMAQLGGRLTFRCFGLVALVLCAVHVVIQLAFARIYPDIERPTMSEVTAADTEDILNANLAEQRNETNEKHKYTNTD